MKYITLLLTVLPILIVVITAASETISWPVGPANTQYLTRTLYHSYGNYHVGWDTLTTPGFQCNFHSGIDIFPYNDNRDVRASKNGYITHIVTDGNQWVVVIVDNSMSSGSGWSYQHICNPSLFGPQPTGWVVGNNVAENELISQMDTFPAIDHMHFAWSTRIYDSNLGSSINPLDSLYNATTHLEWVWNRLLFGQPVGPDTLLFIPDMIDTLWPSSAGALSNMLIDADGLYCSIDILYSYCLEAIGDVDDGTINALNPDRIKWALYRVRNWGPENLFTKYVVDFSGTLGRTPEDSIAYRQFYFRLNPSQQAGLPFSGLISCITNCGDTTSWVDPGISNISENCWQTNQHISGIGTSTIPENAKYPDGPYQVKITSYAHNGTINEITRDIVVDNFVPYVNSVRVYMKSPYTLLYQADWQTLPGSAERVLSSTTFGYLSDSLPNNIGVALGISEPMNPDTLPELWLTGEWGGSVGWSSTEMSEDYQLVPCDWDSENLGSMPNDYWSYYCFETDSGITGYHGQLRLNISGGKDLSGHPIDADPSTVALPRASSGSFPGGIEEGVDNSYLWDAGSLHCGLAAGGTTPPGTVFVDFNLGVSFILSELLVSEILEDNVFFWFYRNTGLGTNIGQCPFGHGFWLVDASQEVCSFNVHILDFEGNYVKSFRATTPFAFRTGGGTFSTRYCSLCSYLPILSGQGMGDYCWVAVYSIICKSAGKSDIDTEAPTYSYLNMYCFNAMGGSSSICLGSGEDAAFDSLFHDPNNEDNVIVMYTAGGMPHTQTLSPPTGNQDGLIELESTSENSTKEELAEPEVAFDLDFSPNPARSEAVFQISLAHDGLIELSILDLTGRLVQRVLENNMPAGVHSVSVPLNLPGGIYFCRLRSGNEMECMKMVIVR